MRSTLIWSLLLGTAGCGASGTRPAPGTATPVGAARAPAVVLVALDGMRWDYLDRGLTPHLQQLAERGVRAERMVPVFPSLTFPNHYTMVTGLLPIHHGIVSNTMRDSVLGSFRISDTAAVRHPGWWGGEPLWETVARQGQRAAAFFWPGSEAPIGGRYPWRWMPFNDRFPAEARVDSVLHWLSLPAAEAPSLVTLYYSDVDHAGHDGGPDAPAVNQAIARVDSLVGRLLSGLATRGLTHVHVLVVSDHGMLATPKDRLILLDDYLDLAEVEVVEWSPVAQLRPQPGREAAVLHALRGAHPRMQVYRREEMPAALHYRDHPRIQPILLLADAGWSITTRARADFWRDGGTHGWDPRTPEMGAIFVGAGPALAQGRVVPPFQNLHLYALVCHLLGITPAPNDGSLDSVRAVLRSSP